MKKRGYSVRVISIAKFTGDKRINAIKSRIGAIKGAIKGIQKSYSYKLLEKV